MIGAGVKLLRVGAAARAARISSIFREPSYTLRFVHQQASVSDGQPVVVQMINYALSHARSHKSDDSYGQALLVLEQCLSTQLSEGADGEYSRGLVLLSMSTLLYERGNFDEAIDKLHGVEELQSSLEVRIAALETLVGLHLELGKDDTSSVVADRCLELLQNDMSETESSRYSGINSRAKAVKGLVELARGNPEYAEPYFQGSSGDKYSIGSIAPTYGNTALSYGEYLHSLRNYSLAKETYKKVIQCASENNGFSETNVAACNMDPEEVLLGATCALGQLEAHLGKVQNLLHSFIFLLVNIHKFRISLQELQGAEELLTKALTKTEEHFGSHHPKVGVVLTCIGLMFRWKAMKERSSSLLVQEGLFKRAANLLKAPPLESEGVEAHATRRDIMALARGGYAEALCVQQNRKGEGDKLKSWAESAWTNRRLSLSEAMDWSDCTPKLPIIDSRISRVL